MAKKKKSKHEGILQMILLLSFVGLIMLGCLCYAVYQKASGEDAKTENGAEQESSTDIAMDETSEDTAGNAENSEEDETVSEDVLESVSENMASDDPLKVSPQATMNADGATWTSFDGHTLGACENTYGTMYSREEILALDGTKQGYGQGVIVDDANRPTGATMLQDKYDKYGALFIAEDSMRFYLTLDEGYENGYSAKIMDALKSCDCHGVFFVTMDYVQKNPDLVQRMINEGHVVGNHSVSHKSMPTLSIEEQANEIIQLHDYVKENFGYDMYLFRPPMGEFSEQTLALAQSLGYRVTLWSYAYKDYDTENQPDPGETYQKVMAAKHGGAVYLLHAVSSTNCAIIPDVVKNLREQGYEVGPIPR